MKTSTDHRRRNSKGHRMGWRRSAERGVQPPGTDRRVLRLAAFATAGTWSAMWLVLLMRDWWGSHLGWDFVHYLDGARAWITAGSPYPVAALVGPMAADIATMPFIHPPIALPLFAAFLVLPAFLWWAIPAFILGAALYHWRPGGWQWYAILGCAAYPRSIEIQLVGNSDMWVVAAIAAGLWFRWPAVLVLVKPTAAVFALAGIRHRGWWIALAVLIGVSALFGSLWGEWFTVVRNVAASGGYLFHSIPLLLLPVLAWHGRTTS